MTAFVVLLVLAQFVLLAAVAIGAVAFLGTVAYDVATTPNVEQPAPDVRQWAAPASAPVSVS